MTETNPMAATPLLPEGFYDLLPPDAREQRHLYLQVLSTFESFGYEEVSPPFMEYEQSLLRGNWDSLTTQTFRLMDPLSREMLGLRTDMTPQVARIAASRLESHSKPLRLCYGGTCFHVTGEGLQKQRQFQQAGAELIGSAEVTADQEILKCAANILHKVVDGEITIDISLPGLRKALLDACPPPLQDRLLTALERKDRQQLAQMDIAYGVATSQLLENIGTEPDWQKWQAAAVQLPKKAADLLNQWIRRCQSITANDLPMRLSFDPLEWASAGYHSDIAFTLFVAGQEEEIGRGGRYLLNHEIPAIGFSLYLNRLRRLQRPVEQPMRCYVLLDNDEADCHRLREKGWVTLHALKAETLEEANAEAVSNRCSHILEKGKLHPV